MKTNSFLRKLIGAIFAGACSDLVIIVVVVVFVVAVVVFLAVVIVDIITGVDTTFIREE